MQIIIAIAIAMCLGYILLRLGDYQNIKQEGGIRTKFNKVFSFFYNLPNSTLTFETKSFTSFIIKDHRCSKSVKLNYRMDHLIITCIVTYFDDTAFDNGKKYSWEIWPKSSYSTENEILGEIQDTFANLP